MANLSNQFWQACHSAVTDSIILTECSILCGNKHIISAPVSKLDMQNQIQIIVFVLKISNTFNSYKNLFWHIPPFNRTQAVGQIHINPQMALRRSQALKVIHRRCLRYHTLLEVIIADLLNDSLKRYSISMQFINHQIQVKHE